MELICYGEGPASTESFDTKGQDVGGTSGLEPLVRLNSEAPIYVIGDFHMAFFFFGDFY